MEKFKRLNVAATLLGLSPMSLYYYLLNNPKLEGNQAQVDYPIIMKFFDLPCDNGRSYSSSQKKISRCLDVLVYQGLIKRWTINTDKTHRKTLYCILEVTKETPKCTKTVLLVKHDKSIINDNKEIIQDNKEIIKHDTGIVQNNKGKETVPVSDLSDIPIFD